MNICYVRINEILIYWETRLAVHDTACMKLIVLEME